MYSATFIFAKKQFDDEFYMLDKAITDKARSILGYLGEETGESTSTGLVSNVYYWESLEALHSLMDDPVHLEAKQKQANWLDGYRVVISKVEREYGMQSMGLTYSA